MGVLTRRDLLAQLIVAKLCLVASQRLGGRCGVERVAESVEPLQLMARTIGVEVPISLIEALAGGA